MHLEKTAEIWDNVVCIVSVNESLAAVVHKPAVDI